MTLLRRGAMLLILCLIAASTADAAISPKLTYQGRLLDSAGVPVANGDYLLRFRIYDALAGGNTLWDDGTRQLTITNGLLTYVLGDSTAIPNNLFANNSSLWLGVKVGVDDEMSPRTEVTAAAFSFQTLRADTAEVAVSVGPNAVTSASIVDGSIGIIDVDDSQIQRRVTGEAGPNQAIRAVNANGSVSLITVGDGDITGITTSSSSGLNGGVSSGTANLSVDPTDFNGSAPMQESYFSGSLISSGSDITIRTASIAVPGPGRIVAMGNVVVRCLGCITSTSGYYLTISSSSTASSVSGSYGRGEVDGDTRDAATRMDVFTVSSPGTYTYYLRGRQSSGPVGSTIDFLYSQLVLLFIPN